MAGYLNSSPPQGRPVDDSFTWWVAGGIAIELAVGHRIRSRGDIDVLLRRDQLVAQQILAGWAVDPPGSLRPWAPGEVLPVGVHDIWCRPGPDEPWRIQVMLDNSRGHEWVSRRDHRVRRPISTLGMTGQPMFVKVTRGAWADRALDRWASCRVVASEMWRRLR
ncbi:MULTISPECIES: hypothetical protein [Streptomyces]|uniref:hypothetical protein n=1 Tax=Streptomyces TaxID=1883 RepID=UPI001F0BCAE1|nr:MULTISPECIES: hypothetical protein [Streptomyces]